MVLFLIEHESIGTVKENSGTVGKKENSAIIEFFFTTGRKK
jgi:hypothetical protein